MARLKNAKDVKEAGQNQVMLGTQVIESGYPTKEMPRRDDDTYIIYHQTSVKAK